MDNTNTNIGYTNMVVKKFMLFILIIHIYSESDNIPMKVNLSLSNLIVI